MLRLLILSALAVCLWVSGARANTRYLIAQTSQTDCGPAALATLLTFYLDVPAQEEEIARLAGANQTGTTLFGLEAATRAKGCGADSFRMSLNTLRRQLAAYPAPLLVRLLSPEPHFALVLSIENDIVFLADPAKGNSLMPVKRFLQRWHIPSGKEEGKESKGGQQSKASPEGYVFIAARADGRTNKARRDELIADLRRQLQALEKQCPAPTMRR